MAKELARRKIAFICAREHAGENHIGPQIKAAFGGVYEQFTREAADAAIAAGEADALAWCKLFIANHDLPQRMKLGAVFNAPDAATFYSGSTQSYTDYPALSTPA